MRKGELTSRLQSLSLAFSYTDQHDDVTAGDRDLLQRNLAQLWRDVDDSVRLDEALNHVNAQHAITGKR